MNKRVGFLGLMFAAAVGLFSPAVASAQNRYDDCRPGYVTRDYRGRDWRAPVPVYRERREWREPVYVAPRYAPVYHDGYRHVEPRPGLSRYGR